MPIEFQSFSATALPPYQMPVLVQMKAESCPSFYRDSEADTLLKARMFYGYTVCVLAFDTDGFGNKYPKHFREIVINEDKHRVSLGGEITFDRVATWAVLP